MLALHCSLINPDTGADETQAPPDRRDARTPCRLMGTLVASPNEAKDEHGVAGRFFVFSDLSCRNPGRYRLSFKLLRIDPMNLQKGAHHPAVADVATAAFDVFTAKEFPGMRASSALLKALRRQGVNVSLKKGSEARKGKGKGKRGRRRGTSSDGSEDDSESSGEEKEGGEEGGRKWRGSTATRDSAGDRDLSPRQKGAKRKKKRRRAS